MRFINRSNNTIDLTSIGRTVYFDGETIETITSDELLRCRDFGLLVSGGLIEVLDIENTRIEKNILRLQNMSKLKLKQDKENQEQDAILVESSDKTQICIKGHFLEGGGYAKVNRNLAFGLDSLGVDVCVDVVGNPRHELTEPEAKKLSKFRKKPNRDAIRVDSIIPSFAQTSAGSRSILYTTVESYTIPEQFVELCGMYGEVWVTSDFCKEILTKSGLKKDIKVLPDSVDTSIYCEEGEAFEFKPNINDFVFLSVFGWSWRKGNDVLLRAYLEEFDSEENVSLLLVSKLHNEPRNEDKIKKEVDNFTEMWGGKNPPHIVRCSKFIPEHKMPYLYRAANAFVLFTRGEGFCLPFCEASLCGLPVIGTNVCGQSMFLNHDNAYLLEPDSISQVSKGKMNVHYWDGQEFPMFSSQQSIEEAKCLMREVYENYNEAKEKNKKLQSFVKENYNIRTVANMAKEILGV